MASSKLIVTKEHRRFIEFADAVRRQKTIGICFGQAGVGKTNSARAYASWDKLEPFLEDWGPRTDEDERMYAMCNRKRAVFYNPQVMTTAKLLKSELRLVSTRLSICVDEHLISQNNRSSPPHDRPGNVQLIIVDECERLNAVAVEHLRDFHDRTQIAMILIGMPGMEKQFSRYPQLYSRIGFAHEYKALGQDEIVFVLQRWWMKLGLTLNMDDFTDAQAVGAILRVTRGNFRLIIRLFAQIERVMKINELTTITDEVVDAARSTLVIGYT